MQALHLVLPESQYERLQHEAQRRHISMSDLVLEATEAFLRSETVESRYTRLACKQAMWRTRQGVGASPQPDVTGEQIAREQAVGYVTRSEPSIDTHLANLRLDLVYHSEALEGSPLTKSQVEDAVRELSPR